MIPRVMHAEYLGEYKIRLRFVDGAEGDVDLSSELYGEVFEPLKDKDLFRRFSIHPEFGTLVWANGADIAPETLRGALNDVRRARPRRTPAVSTSKPRDRKKSP